MPRRGDSLSRLVEQGDCERATPSKVEPSRLILPPRQSATRRTCYECRRVPRYDQFIAEHGGLSSQALFVEFQAWVLSHCC